MHVRKTEVVPVECVARGYLAGSGWKEYKASGTVCGIPLPAGYRKRAGCPSRSSRRRRRKKAAGTTRTSASSGWPNWSVRPPRRNCATGRSTCIGEPPAYAESRGIILADTKLEWGRLPTGELILIDEVLTPDSSRFWPKDTYRPGASPPSFDKQFVRDWLETTGWDKTSPPPALPPEVVEKTAAKYREALEQADERANGK